MNEWSQSDDWTDEYLLHCTWFGIRCDESNTTAQLRLKTNSLSGQLTPMISKLTNLTYLDLRDNDIRVSLCQL